MAVDTAIGGPDDLYEDPSVRIGGGTLVYTESGYIPITVCDGEVVIVHLYACKKREWCLNRVFDPACNSSLMQEVDFDCCGSCVGSDGRNMLVIPIPGSYYLVPTEDGPVKEGEILAGELQRLKLKDYAQILPRIKTCC